MLTTDVHAEFTVDSDVEGFRTGNPSPEQKLRSQCASLFQIPEEDITIGVRPGSVIVTVEFTVTGVDADTAEERINSLTVGEWSNVVDLDVESVNVSGNTIIVTYEKTQADNTVGIALGASAVVLALGGVGLYKWYSDKKIAQMKTVKKRKR